MKKLMLKYLNRTYPKAFIKRTAFGRVLMNGKDDYLKPSDLSRELSDLFGEKKEVTNYVVDLWLLSLPVFGPIPHATNLDVLVWKN